MDPHIEIYASRMVLSHSDKVALHRLFSPSRVPLGFTDLEVRLCIKLDLLRDELRDENLNYFLMPFCTLDIIKDFEKDIPRTIAFRESLYNFMIFWANK
ncbi:MAG: hypothetical protein JWL92_197 [Candidatus Nomurabacteria bacterium]|nr:hypothetical protein [Candidatus Nomurabacteria bacterium]